MLNPYGNRLGISNFWQGTFNVYYSENLNFKFYELFAIVKFTIDLFILNLFENTKKSKDASFLLLFVSLNLNILKFKNKRLDIFLKLFDYRMFVMFVENNYKTRHFMLLRFLRMFFRLFTFRLKKIQTIKNIVDWKLLVFYEHLYTNIITQEFRNKEVSQKKHIYNFKNLDEKNYFYKILYKLRFFVKLNKLEILKLKYLKVYIKNNKKINKFFFFVKKKFLKNLVILKKNLEKKLTMQKKNFSAFKIYKKYNYFKKFLILFETKSNKKLVFNVKFTGISKILKKQNIKVMYKNNISSSVFKFYRSNFKIFFLKKRPFVFTISQKNITKNPLLFLNDITKSKNRKIKYSDFEKIYTSFFSKMQYPSIKYSLSNLKKNFFSQKNIKKEFYFKKKRYNFAEYLSDEVFSNYYYRKSLYLFMLLFKRLKNIVSNTNLVLEKTDLKFLNSFFLFVEDIEKVSKLTFLPQKFFNYKDYFLLIKRYKEMFLKNIVSNDFLLFSKLIIFFYEIQKAYAEINNSFMLGIFPEKNKLNIFVSKRYIKIKKNFNSIIKPLFFNKIKKKKLNVSLTKKFKIEKLKKSKNVKITFIKKLKLLRLEKNGFFNKKENFGIALTKYKQNLKINRQNQKQNIKDVFVNKFDYFFEQATKKNKKMVIVRMKKCQDNFIILTLPFLFKVMQMYNFEYLALKCNFVSSSVSAAMIARYAITRMRQGFSIGQALYGMRFGIKRSKKFAGFKFCAAGRFSRRQIATYRWIKGGSLSINTRIFGFDYAHDNFIGTFGIYGFKVWLLKAKKKINNTYG